MFSFVFPCFLEGESKYLKRRDAKTQSFSFFEHEMHGKNENPFVHLVFSVFRINLCVLAPLRLINN